VIPAEEVARIDRANRAARAEALKRWHIESAPGASPA
jgi:hypothetical protein